MKRWRLCTRANVTNHECRKEGIETWATSYEYFDTREEAERRMEEKRARNYRNMWIVPL